MRDSCLPVLMYDKKKKAAATVHSGWRGTAAKICAAVISDMKNELGTDPGDLICAIGPSIGPCCFQIKSDAVEVFLKNFENFENLKMFIDMGYSMEFPLKVKFLTLSESKNTPALGANPFGLKTLFTINISLARATQKAER